MTKRIRSVINRLSPLLRISLIAGIVISAAIYPVAALTGLTAKSGADLINALPREVPSVPPAQTTYVYANDGETLLTMFYEEHRRYTPIHEISRYMQQAIVASEDGRFYDHTGVDSKGIGRAFVANTQSGAVEQGASTLTMQYVRMALRDGAQTPAEAYAATEQTSARKVREARLAIEVEKQMSKTEILEQYLNRAYFGHRAYGVFSAAEIFYSKEPKDLTLNESATLAGLVQAPSAYDPASQDGQAATQRRNWVLDRMVELGYISPEVGEQERGKPIELDLSTPRNDCISVSEEHNEWGFFCDVFRNWWLSQPAFGDNPLKRADALRRGGYTVVTSLDPEIQSIAQQHVVAKEPIGSPFAHGTVVTEPGTGHVKAMAINRTYSLDQSQNGRHTNWYLTGERRGNYPNTVNPMLGGGGMAGFQAGSTFKWFVLLAALDAGLPMTTSFFSPYTYQSSYPGWSPSNASGAMTGTHTMWSGFGQSVNTYFVQLQEAVGAENAVRMAERLGLRWRTDVDQLMASPERANGWGPFTLGVSDATPLEMANAYAVGAADGVFCEVMPVMSIKDLNGKEVTHQNEHGEEVRVAAPRCTQAVDPEVARAAADAGLCVTGFGARRGGCGSWSTAEDVAGISGDRIISGKTGTTEYNRAAWFIGFTPELSAASFIADPDTPVNAVGGGNAFKPIYSGTETLSDALADQPVTSFTPPSGPVLGGGW